jgi:hypothetical protein
MLKKQHFFAFKRSKACKICNVEKQKYRKYTLQDAIALAEEKGGKCLSTEYNNTKSILDFCCKDNHIFKARFNSIRRGTWCKQCANKSKYTIEDVVKVIEEKGGRCLSTEYINNRRNLKVCCETGHIFNIAFKNIISGNWCNKCFILSKRFTIEEARKLAIENKGKCLSKKYLNTQQRLKFKCELGHLFTGTMSGIKSRNSWCPECSRCKTENTCKDVFEELFNLKFLKVRPKWLMGFKNKPLELDGYCDSLNLAFEYNGGQHYKIVSVFNGNKDSLEYQQKKDALKVERCKEQGVKLIVIKPIENPTKQKVKLVILQLLQEENINVPEENTDNHRITG